MWAILHGALGVRSAAEQKVQRLGPVPNHEDPIAQLRLLERLQGERDIARLVFYE
jgi:hypothetical protein